MAGMHGLNEQILWMEPNHEHSASPLHQPEEEKAVKLQI